MSRSLAIGVVLAAVMIYVFLRIRPAGLPWKSAAGRLSLAALAVAALTIGLGLVPRQTSNGYIICGPPLNLPDSIPAFTNAGADWADSSACSELMEGPMWWLVSGIAGSAGLFTAASVAQSRSRSSRSDNHACLPA